MAAGSARLTSLGASLIMGLVRESMSESIEFSDRRQHISGLPACGADRRAGRRGTGGLAGLVTVVFLIAATSGGVWWWTRSRGECDRQESHAAHGRPRRLRAQRHRARRSRGVRRDGSPLAGEVEQHDGQRHPADRARGDRREEGRLPGRARFVGAEGPADDAEDCGQRGEGGRGRGAQQLRHGA